MEKLGFVYEGTLRQCTERFDGQLLDVLCFSLSREEYERAQNSHSTVPRIETERLVLRGFTMDDLADFNAYCQNPDVGPNAGWPPHQSLEESGEVLRSFMQGGQVWAVCERERGRVIRSACTRTSAATSIFHPAGCSAMPWQNPAGDTAT